MIAIGRQSPLRVIFVLSLAGYVLLAVWFPLRPHYNQLPLADIFTLRPLLWQGIAYGALLVGLFGLYGWGYRLVQSGQQTISRAWLVTTAVLLALPLLFTYPYNANDIYRYFIRGRITAVHADSPFLLAPADFPDDPYLPLAGEWAGETSPYGPVWEMVAGGLTAVVPDNLWFALLLFKGVGLLTFVACGLLIEQLARRPAQRGLALLWLWNPALLLTFVADAHNDGLMLLWLLLGWWLIQRGKPTAGFALMLLSPLTKPIGLLALPFFFSHIWHSKADWRARGAFLLWSGLAGVTAVAVTFAPFGSPLALVERLWREAAGGAGFSPAAWLILASRRLGWGLSLTALSQLLTAVLILGLVALFWRGWRGRSPLRGSADAFGLYLITALNFRLWYTVWPFPFLLLEDAQTPNGRYRRHVGLWLLATTQLSVLIYGHLRIFWLGGDHLPAHTLGVLFTLGLPLLLARFTARSKQTTAPNPPIPPDHGTGF